jgi:hypothetical protein
MKPQVRGLQGKAQSTGSYSLSPMRDKGTHTCLLAEQRRGRLLVACGEDGLVLLDVREVLRALAKLKAALGHRKVKLVDKVWNQRGVVLCGGKHDPR